MIYYNQLYYVIQKGISQRTLLHAWTYDLMVEFSNHDLVFLTIDAHEPQSK